MPTTGMFDDGWDAMRERVFARQKELGWIPADAALNPRPEGIAAWDDIPADQRGFQTRLMELFAGFVQDADEQAGRIVDEIEAQGQLDNTIVIYIFGDNGASAEGQNGTISELLAQNNIPNTTEQQLAALERLGGLEVLGSPVTDNMYNAGFAWAGNTPVQIHQADCLGFRRHPQPDGDFLARRDRARFDPPHRSSITSTTSRRRSTKSSGSRRRRS